MTGHQHHPELSRTWEIMQTNHSCFPILQVGILRPREGRDLTQICHWLEAKPGPGPRCLAFHYRAHYPALILLWNYL